MPWMPVVTQCTCNHLYMWSCLSTAWGIILVHRMTIPWNCFVCIAHPRKCALFIVSLTLLFPITFS